MTFDDEYKSVTKTKEPLQKRLVGCQYEKISFIHPETETHVNVGLLNVYSARSNDTKTNTTTGKIILCMTKIVKL